jgi:hemerythrin
MSATFAWKDAYSVKIVSIDNQHKKLFDLVNELDQAMAAGHGKDVAKDVLDRLVGYTVQHFAAEERLMDAHKFPGAVSHKGEHKALTDKVLAFKKDFESGAVGITPSLLGFLQHWLRDHIQKVDRQYTDFLNAHGVH